MLLTSTCGQVEHVSGDTLSNLPAQLFTCAATSMQYWKHWVEPLLKPYLHSAMVDHLGVLSL
jgi:hypothetical protein